MKLTKKTEKLLNDQVNMELGAAYQYQAMAAHFESLGLEGFAKWMDNQAKEEIEHSRKFYDYLLSRNGKVVLEALGKPKGNFKTVKEVFEDSLKHEQSVTKSIEAIYENVRKEKDYGAEVFLNWFVSEQEEEEETVQKIIDKITLLNVDKDSVALYMFDKEMGERTEE
jgi:Ferritin-like protein